MLIALAVAAASLVESAKEYRIGVDFAPQLNIGVATYEAPINGTPGEGCSKISETQQSCGLLLFPRKLSAWGVFLQKPYKRTRSWYFEFGLSAAIRNYESEMINTTANPEAENGGTELVERPPPPIQRMETNLYGLSTRGFLMGGYTPEHAPEVYLTLGMGFALMAGTVRIDDQIARHVFVNPVLVQEVEALWWRILKDGALSSYIALETPYKKTVEVPEDRDDVSHLKMSLMSITVGLAKLVIPFH